MSRSSSTASSQSVPGSSTAPPATLATPNQHREPPHVHHTARRPHTATHNNSRSSSSRSSLDDFISEAAQRSARRPPSAPASHQPAPSRLPTPPQRRPPTQPRRRSPSAATSAAAAVLQERLRTTLTIAEAEAVRAARTFSLDMYRELHQRKFRSRHEELDFLRKDFVASRRTLALLHEDNVRLERELLARVRKVGELQDKLEEAYKEAEGHALPSPPSRPARRGDFVSAEHPHGLGTEATQPRRSLDDSDTAVLWTIPVNVASTAAEAGETVQQEEGRSGSSHSKENVNEASVRVAAGGPPSLKSTAKPPSPSPSASLQTTLSHTHATPLALYASSARKRVGTSSSENNAADMKSLIRELRANLARRDTALNAAQMDLAAVQQAQQRTHVELRTAREALQQAKEQRDKLQGELTTLEAQHAAQAQAVEDERQAKQQLEKDKAELQRRLTTAELLYDHTGPRRVSGAEGADAASVISPVADHSMREQLQLYRGKWQAAEDEVEHLHQRLSQLQRQLVDQGRERATESHAVAAAAQRGSSPPLLPTPVPVDSSAEQRAAQLQAEHALDVERLRRQHQDQLQLLSKETQRLQRRLTMAQDNAAFHEDQLRQQRQEDARQHHSEMQALQAQLRTAQGELVKAQQDREHLARQLRRSTEQETTVEVLRGQVEQLKQRLGEVGAELAQVRGREKESALLVQRERMAAAGAEHAAEVAREQLAQVRREMEYLQAEVTLLREQLGRQEASRAAAAPVAEEEEPPSADPLKPVRASASRGDAARSPVHEERGGRDAASMASELKGYASLMRINATLQRRVAELEGQVAALQTAPSLPPAGPTVHVSPCTMQYQFSQPASPPPVPTESSCSAAAAHASPPPPPSAVPDLAAAAELARLRSELESALHKQRDLLDRSAAAEQDRSALAHDNMTLARGIELLEKQLRKLKAARAAEREKHREREAAWKRARSKDKQARQRLRSASARRHAEVAQQSARDEAMVTMMKHLRGSAEESRLRQRLQTARARDQLVEQERPDVGSPPPTLSSEPVARPAESGVACPTQLPAASSSGAHCGPSSSPSGSQQSPAQQPQQLPPSAPEVCAAPPQAPLAEPIPLWCIIETVRRLHTASPPCPPTAPAAPSLAEGKASQSSQHEAAAAAVVTRPPVDSPSATPVGAPATERRDVASSPLRSPRRQIRGSLLPPVFCPPLVSKGCA